MAATFEWQGADSAGNPFTIGGSGASVNWSQSADWSVGYQLSPIPAGSASMERYLRMHWSGAFNAITAAKFWRSDTNALATGVTIGAGGLADGNGLAFATPSTTANADAGVPAAESAANAVVHPDSSPDGGGSVYGPRLASGAARWLRLQVRTTSSTPAGNVSNADPCFVFTGKYTEN